jgi:BioD-like phosphotransacetylase family protein
MIALYVVSTESFSGKTSLCYGIAARLKHDGMRVGYFKPLVFFGKPMDGRAVSEDALFLRQTLALAESPDVIAPVVLDALAIENAAAGRPNDYAERIDRAFAEVSRDKDLVVVEGAATLAEGNLLGLGPRQMADRLDARVMAVAKYGNELAADGLFAGREQFGNRWLGAVLNEVPPSRIDFVAHSMLPALGDRGVFVYAVLPQERLLLSITVDEIADIVGAEVLNSPEHVGELVENIMVGAMSTDSALSYFRHKPNKAVITGGDRADIALAALETSTRCLVLTGNLRPNPLVLGRAEELGIPLLLAKQDTLTAVEIIQRYFGRLQLHEPRKVERLTALLNERFDFGRLKVDIGLG